MKKKILWVSSTKNPDDVIRPNASNYTLLEAMATYGTEEHVVSRATSYNEFVEALEINKEQPFDEMCIDYDITPTKNGVDCINYLSESWINELYEVPQITIITDDSEEKEALRKAVDNFYGEISAYFD